MREISVAIILRIIFAGLMYGAIFSSALAGNSPVEPGFQASFLYKGNSANDDYHDGDFDELQGVANGDPATGHPFWYFSRNEKYQILNDPRTIIYRVHYAEHLANDFSCDPKTVLFNGEISCTHVGDIAYHLYAEKGYLLGAYNSCNDEKAYIAVFRADDLGNSGDYLNVHALIDVSGFQSSECPWVAVSSNGRIFSGSGKMVGKENEFYEYTVSWAAIELGGSTPVSISSSQTHFLTYQDGSPFIIVDWQGADFSSDGQLFFLTAGLDHWLGCQDPWKKRIHVFEKGSGSTWALRRSSTYEENDMPFLFEVNCEEEPEGVSYFDMNSVTGYHPSMPRGQLHVILLNNNVPGSSDDSVWIKHYSSIIDVSTGESVHDAYYDRWGEGAWDGSILRIKGGAYNEPVTLGGKRVKIVTKGAPVIIGEP